MFSTGQKDTVKMLQVWEYYTTNSAWPLETGGPDNSQLFQRYSSMFVLVLSIDVERPRKAKGQNMHNCPSAEHNQQHSSTKLYQTKAFFPRMAHLHGSLNFPVCTRTVKNKNSGLLSISPTEQISSFRHINGQLTAHVQFLCSSRRRPLPTGEPKVIKSH